MRGQSARKIKGKDLPLCVDLERDLLRPHFAIERWMISLKKRTERPVFAALLPYRSEVVDRLREEKRKGREIVLVVRREDEYSAAVEEHLKIFSNVVTRNAGPVDAETLPRSTAPENWARIAKALWLEMRPHQWVKNLCLILPIFLAWKVPTSETLLNMLFGVISFSFAASAVYIINDLFDLAEDRNHPHKKHRPLASGELPLVYALAAIPILAGTSLTIAYYLPFLFLPIVAGYLATNLFYSLHFKKKLVLDVVFLASLYTIRLYAGGIVADVLISRWLLLFSLFLFTSLALVKRLTELKMLIALKGDSADTGRGYQAVDVVPVVMMATASAIASILVFLLYVESPEVRATFQHRPLLYLSFPLLFYWLGRTITIAHRGELHSDPVCYALTDKATRLVFVLLAAVWLIAKGLLG